MVHDLKIAFRSLRRSLRFSLAILFTIALAIAGNTTIFSVVNGVWLRPLPYKAAEGLVWLQFRVPALMADPIGFSAPDLGELRRHTETLADAGAFVERDVDLAAGGAPVRVKGARITASLFPMLGVAPANGRLFTQDEDSLAVRVLLISYRFWQRQFGGRTDIIGRQVLLDRQPYQIAGVMPPGFSFPEPTLSGAGGGPADIWMPMSWTREELATRGDNFMYKVIARLKPGVSRQRASEDFQRVANRIRETYPAELPPELKLEGSLTPLLDRVVGKLRPALLVLMGAVLMLLLIACANIANILLSRNLGRQREIALRQALGAGRGRLARQFVAESFLLGVAGGAIGLLLSQIGLDALLGNAPTDLPRLSEVRIDAPVMLFTLTLSILAAALFGTLPALLASRTQLADSLRSTGVGAKTTRGRAWVNGFFVVAQVSLAVVLLVGAGLLTRTFMMLRNLDPGFRTGHVLTASVSLPKESYPKPELVDQFHRRLLEAAAAQPEIRAAGVAATMPMQDEWTRVFTLDGQQSYRSGPKPLVSHNVVAGAYFDAMGIPLKAGRLFQLGDRSSTARVAVVSESFARRYFPGQSALGARFKWGVPGDDRPWLQIAGIVGDVKTKSPDEEAPPQTYEYWPQVVPENALRNARVVVRTSGEPQSAVAALRETVRQLDAAVALAEVQSTREVMASRLVSREFNMYLLGIFAAMALVLAGVGIFGVMANLVTQRIPELGVRRALGATSGSLLGLVLGRGLRMAAAGIALGIIGAVASGRALGTLVYGVSAGDPATFVLVVMVVLAVAVGACAGPAVRALRVEPTRALRWE